jgi:hypothetical protein
MPRGTAFFHTTGEKSGLATIKNPPVVFARQANIAQGPQQVNNGMMPASELENQKAAEQTIKGQQ